MASIVFLAMSMTTPATADPAAGGSLQLGQSLAGESSWRLGAGLHLLQSQPAGWQFGGEVGGSIEAYTGGWGCGTFGNDVENVPALAVICYQPSTAAHALVGYRAQVTSASSIALHFGAGATVIFTVPGRGGETQYDVHPSMLGRVAYLVRVGAGLGARWSIGIAAEQRAIGMSDPHVAPSIGITVEGGAH